MAQTNESKPHRTYLENQLRRKPDLPLAAGSRSSPGQIQRRGDNSEGCGVGDVGARIVEMGRVGHPKHLHPKLKFHLLGDVEVAKDAGIEIEEPRPADDIAASGAKPYLRPGHGAERGWIEVMT